MKVKLYDFDNTIYNGDSTKDFYFYCLKKNKTIIKYIPYQIGYICLYKLKLKSKKEAKEKFFIFLKDIKNLDKLLIDFWNANFSKMALWYVKKEHSKDVIVSASPEFLLAIPAKKLGVLKLIATKVEKTTGLFTTENCYGIEKINRIKKEIKNAIIEEAYSDSTSDMPMLNLAKEKFLIKKEKIINLNK